MERPWLPALPKIEKELELMRVCVDSINTHKDIKSHMSDQIIEHSMNILLRYLKNLDSMSSYEKPKDHKFTFDE